MSFLAIASALPRHRGLRSTARRIARTGDGIVDSINLDLYKYLTLSSLSPLSPDMCKCRYDQKSI